MPLRHSDAICNSNCENHSRPHRKAHEKRDKKKRIQLKRWMSIAQLAFCREENSAMFRSKFHRHVAPYSTAKVAHSPMIGANKLLKPTFMVRCRFVRVAGERNPRTNRNALTPVLADNAMLFCVPLSEWIYSNIFHTRCRLSFGFMTIHRAPKATSFSNGALACHLLIRTHFSGNSIGMQIMQFSRGAQNFCSV